MRSITLAVAAGALGVIGSCIERAGAQVAELALPSTHRAWKKAWGGDPDSWDLFIGFTPSMPNMCSGTVVYIAASKGCWPSDQYYEGTCYGFYHDETANVTVDYQDLSYSTACVSDLSSYLDDLFGDQEYLRIDYFNDTGCAELDVSNIMIADGACHARYVTVNESTNVATTESRVAVVDESGAATFRKYASADCTGEPTEDFTFSKNAIKSHKCVDSAVARVADSGLTAGAIAGIVVGVVAFLALVAGIVWWRRRKSRAAALEKEADELGRKLEADNATALEADAPTMPDNKAHAYRVNEA